MKKALSLLLPLILLTGCFSAALAEKYPEGTLYKGMKGHTAEIKQLQQWLIDLEYLDDQADGKFGQNTQNAVKAFQKDRGLNADGIAWPETMELVEIYANEPLVEYPEGTLHRGIYGYTEEIEYLQYQLFYAGYLGEDSSVVDGVFGQKTEAAVRQFQKEHGIDVTGIVCPNTQMALDVEWENRMEPQGDPDPHSGCYTAYYANGNAYLVLCQRHLLLHEEAAALLNDDQNYEQTAEAMQAGVTLWLEEMDSLYNGWRDIQYDQAELIANVQENFMDYYRANLALWNVHFGPAPSLVALDMAYTMLSEHATELCCMLDERY